MGSDEARALKVTRGWVAAVAVALAVLAVTSAVLEVQVHRLQGEVRNAQDRMVVPYTPADPASADNARGLCRVLGALAKSQGVHLDRVFTAEVMTDCEQQAIEGAAAVASP